MRRSRLRLRRLLLLRLLLSRLRLRLRLRFLRDFERDLPLRERLLLLFRFASRDPRREDDLLRGEPPSFAGVSLSCPLRAERLLLPFRAGLLGLSGTFIAIPAITARMEAATASFSPSSVSGMFF